MVRGSAGVPDGSDGIWMKRRRFLSPRRMDHLYNVPAPLPLLLLYFPNSPLSPLPHQPGVIPLVSKDKRPQKHPQVRHLTLRSTAPRSSHPIAFSHTLLIAPPSQSALKKFLKNPHLPVPSLAFKARKQFWRCR